MPTVKVVLTSMLLLLPLPRIALAQITGDIPPGATPIEIRVHARPASSTPIPQTIFGSFLEPIDNSTYGGLWAEVLENPSFEPGLWTAPNVARMIHDQPELARASQSRSAAALGSSISCTGQPI